MANLRTNQKKGFKKRSNFFTSFCWKPLPCFLKNMWSFHCSYNKKSGCIYYAWKQPNLVVCTDRNHCGLTIEYFCNNLHTFCILASCFFQMHLNWHLTEHNEKITTNNIQKTDFSKKQSGLNSNALESKVQLEIVCPWQLFLFLQVTLMQFCNLPLFMTVCRVF